MKENFKENKRLKRILENLKKLILQNMSYNHNIDSQYYKDHFLDVSMLLNLDLEDNKPKPLVIGKDILLILAVDAIKEIERLEYYIKNKEELDKLLEFVNKAHSDKSDKFITITEDNFREYSNKHDKEAGESLNISFDRDFSLKVFSVLG